ncbi:MAG TPA: penicillin-binding transpeptidase domain-containing protein [bacterium]|nr:penicillin-binding transpeptidase domain-containing protein [bacterium]
MKKVRFKIGFVGVFFFLLFLLVGARAFELHLTDNEKLSHLAKNQYHRKVVVAPKRGTILDRHGDTLAIDLQVDSLYASPHLIEDRKAFAKAVASLLGWSEAKVQDKIDDKKKKFVWLKRRLSPEDSAKLKELKLAGLGTLPEYKRFYPNGVLAANLLGAVGYDAEALSGLEMAKDEVLRSQDPPKLIEQDAKGRSYSPFALMGLEHPNGVVLTIDKTIQYIAERELKAAVDKAKAAGGVALVLDVKTGAVLGMAVQPTFDPNEYYKYEPQHWRNRAVTDLFEPGSIFKAVTAAIALETGAFDLKKTLHCENGAMQVGKFTINDTHGHGPLNLNDIIKYSSNICSYKLAQLVGKKTFYEKMRDFGFGQKSGIEVPGEVGGLMPTLANLGSLQLGTIAFGQGISTTPLQIASAYVAIANGGFLMKPYLIQEIRDSKDKTLQTFGPQILRQVVSETTAKEMAKMLETVVEKGGTGTAARLEEFRVAGKTGTAQKVVAGSKGYAKNKYVASFVGFAPSRDPRLVVLVSIDEPKGDYYGGLVSAPPFREIMGQSLAYLKTPPDPIEPETKLAEAKGKAKPAVKKGKPVAAPEEAVETVEAISGDSETVVAQTTVPDLTGLSVREALRRGQSKNFKVKIRGSGICNRQEPQAGGDLETGAEIVLDCEPPI